LKPALSKKSKKAAAAADKKAAAGAAAASEKAAAAAERELVKRSVKASFSDTTAKRVTDLTASGRLRTVVRQQLIDGGMEPQLCTIAEVQPMSATRRDGSGKPDSKRCWLRVVFADEDGAKNAVYASRQAALARRQGKADGEPSTDGAASTTSTPTMMVWPLLPKAEHSVRCALDAAHKERLAKARENGHKIRYAADWRSVTIYRPAPPGKERDEKVETLHLDGKKSK
jgi:hypothetical protein